MRYLLAILWLVCSAACLSAQSLEIKGAGVRTVTVVESLPFTIQAPNEPAKGTAIFGHQWEYKRETVTATARDNVLEVTAATKGTLVVYCAWWVVDFAAQKVERKTAFVTFAVGEVGPGPIPPDPLPPVGIAKHLSFIGPNTSTAATVADVGLRDWLKSNGVTVHVLAANSPHIETSKLTAAVARAGGAPCLVIQDASGHVLDAAKIGSVADVKSLTGKYVK